MRYIGFDADCYQYLVAESSDLLKWKIFCLATGLGNKGVFYHVDQVLGAFLYEDYSIISPRRLNIHRGKFW